MLFIITFDLEQNQSLESWIRIWGSIEEVDHSSDQLVPILLVVGSKMVSDFGD